MCNLLIPVCPYILHSLSKNSRNSTNDQQDTERNTAVDAKILYNYLSKKPYEYSKVSPTSNENENNSKQTTKQYTHESNLNMLTSISKANVKPNTRLYRLTTWHTCPCFFWMVTVLHPYPGPSRAAFGSALQRCNRCSASAKVLRPMRMGGMHDVSAKGDQYWERCVFLNASDVFEGGSSDIEPNVEPTGQNDKAKHQSTSSNPHSEQDRDMAPPPSRKPTMSSRTYKREQARVTQGNSVVQKKVLGKFEIGLDKYLQDVYDDCQSDNERNK